MSTATPIEWTDSTWTPIKARHKFTGKVGWHCEKVSGGCKHCYAETFNGRMLPNGGTGLPYTRQSREAVDIFLDEKTLTQPLRWKKPRRVFVCSMTDLFAEFVPFDLIDRVFAVMALCPQHTFQVLTKRPERMAEYTTQLYAGLRSVGPASDGMWSSTLASRLQVASAFGIRPGNGAAFGPHHPFPNVWLGTSVENQPEADRRVGWLLRCPAAVRFLSVEPLIGPVDLTRVSFGMHRMIDSLAGDLMRVPDDDGDPEVYAAAPGSIHWVIVGGESGPGARPMHPDWVRSLRDQCVAAEVAFFFKQWGAWVPVDEDEATHFVCACGYHDEHNSDRHDKHTDGDGCTDSRWCIRRVGKKAAGRLLDGREWNEMPLIGGAS
jgi:protein gp37